MSETNRDTSGNSPPEFVSIDVKETLRFFDEKPDWSEKQATSLVSVVGEDLNAACFQHYVESSMDAKVTVRTDPVTTGRTRGPRLDRWIEVDPFCGRRIVFQTEIKNWSSHAFDGETLPVKATPEELANYKSGRWERKWDSETKNFRWDSIAKVLVPMKPPDDLQGLEVLPLLIFWEAIGPRDKAKCHLFQVDDISTDFPFDPPASWIDVGKFPTLWIFTVSSYLRSISDDRIALEMPNAAKRIEILNRLFSNT